MPSHLEQDQQILIQQGEPSLGSIYGQREIDAVQKSITASMSPDVGFYAAEDTLTFERAFATLCDTQHAIAMNGAGGAIDLLIRSLDIQKGDEIISCPINFPGTHLAVLGSGARLVFSEPDPKTLNLDPKGLAARLTPHTKAVLVTYMNGLAADTDGIRNVINESPLFEEGKKPKIIVDAARSLGTTYHGVHVGKEAWATVFSLQSKKLITTLGEGGMIVTNDPTLDKKLRQFRSFGQNEGWGSNYKMTKVQAAVGLVQLERINDLVRLRRDLADQRNDALAKFPDIVPQGDTPYSNNSYYLYTLVLPENVSGTRRDELMKVLKTEYGIGTVVGNPPTSKLNRLIEEQTRDQHLPIAEDLGQRIICVSIHPSITTETNKYVIDSFVKAYERTFTK